MALTVILDLKVQIIPKHNDFYSIRSVVPKLVENDTSYAFVAILVQEITFSGIQYGVGGHFFLNGLSKYFLAPFKRGRGLFFFK